ncbi:MAG: hypothetical protein UU37_C0005G0001, partial [Candidatus Gottesmanbacteria bacterium GW2011_GWA2_41_12]
AHGRAVGYSPPIQGGPVMHRPSQISGWFSAAVFFLLFGAAGPGTSAQQPPPQKPPAPGQAAGAPQAGRGSRPEPAMDPARARRLYVSNDPKDHSLGYDFQRDMDRKAATDKRYQEVTRGVVDFSKVSYRSSVGDMDIPAYLFQPLKKRGANGHAAMVWVHGGVHGNWGEAMWPFVQEAVKRGYVVICPEYRGSTGYGEKHHNEIDYGGYEIDDVMSAVGYLQTLPHVKGPGYQAGFATQKRIQGLPFEKPALYIERSPLYHVDKLRVPLLVHVATNDTDVNFVEDQQMVDALRSRKADLAETKIYVDPPPGRGGGGHTFSRRVNPETLQRADTPEQIDSWNRTWTFFEWSLKPSLDKSKPATATSPGGDARLR